MNCSLGSTLDFNFIIQILYCSRNRCFRIYFRLVVKLAHLRDLTKGLEYCFLHLLLDLTFPFILFCCFFEPKFIPFSLFIFIGLFLLIFHLALVINQIDQTNCFSIYFYFVFAEILIWVSTFSSEFEQPSLYCNFTPIANNFATDSTAA